MLVIIPLERDDSEASYEVKVRPRLWMHGKLSIGVGAWETYRFPSQLERAEFVLRWEYDLEIRMLTRAQSYWECRDAV
jgi:hypothetical protein